MFDNKHLARIATSLERLVSILEGGNTPGTGFRSGYTDSASNPESASLDLTDELHGVALEEIHKQFGRPPLPDELEAIFGPIDPDQE